MAIFNKTCRWRLPIIIPLLLTIATFAVYWQVQGFDFVNFDDNDYVFQNIHIKNGVTLKNIAWAFTEFHSGNWHPLTWLSHMIDCEIFGLWAGGHHLTNLFFHIANAVLLFFVFQGMTGQAWQSGFVATLFALHPLHVESVAWISERKDVLSTFFWMLTLLAYIRYVRRPHLSTWAWVPLLFILGLMSKAMVVTLPFALLLLDFWPLNRFQFLKTRLNGQFSALHLITEKAPLFALAAVFCVIAINAQKHGASITDLSALPFSIRISNAITAYMEYMTKMLYPLNLAVLYPYRKMIPWWDIASASAVLFFMFVAAMRTIKKQPYFTVGWLWYFGTLVPVIGLIQIGRQSIADRYTYIPLIGLFVIIAWGIPQMMNRMRHKTIWLTVSATLTMLILASLSWNQIRHWKNSETLFTHALKKTSDNYLAHNQLGLALLDQGHIKKAENQYRLALRIHPYYIEAQNNLGMALYRQGQIDEAITLFLKALQLNPGIPEIHLNLGLALYQKGSVDDAIYQFLQVIELNPNIAAAHLNAANAFYEQGEMNSAIHHFKKTLELKTESPEIHTNLANALQKKGLTDQAITHYLKAIALNPRLPEIHNNLGVAYIFKNDISRAISCFQDALEIQPDHASAKSNFQKALMMKKQLE